jgi:lipoate-protein ligase A
LTPASLPTPSWSVERHRGSAVDFHARPLPDPPDRAVWVFEVDRPALVLGSAQPESDVDLDRVAAAGVELVRRRSGGGAVLLVPGEVLWVDVVVPRADPQWHDDVGRASWWLGETWRRALASLGWETDVHRGPMVRSNWSSLLCFSGVGPGEVMAGERKVVGLSQRRTRAAARFQCAVYRRFDGEALLDLLRLERAERTAAADHLARSVTGVDVAPAELAEDFLAALPA